jgi:hypothetical protein
MAITLSTPSGRKVTVEANAVAVSQNDGAPPQLVSTATFDDGLKDTLFLPRDSKGLIKLKVKLQTLPTTFDVEGLWTYSKQRNQLVFPSRSKTPSGGVSNVIFHGNIDFVTEEADSSVWLKFSLIWGDAWIDFLPQKKHRACSKQRTLFRAARAIEAPILQPLTDRGEPCQ